VVTTVFRWLPREPRGLGRSELAYANLETGVKCHYPLQLMPAGDRMKDKATVRYQGYRTLADGARGFDFSVALIGEEEKFITIAAAADLFQGPNRIAIQDGAGICYETLRSRINADSTIPAAVLSLNSTDIAQHRKPTKHAGRRY
jgi:hypothetical protein